MRKFKQFIENEASGGIVLIVTAIIALFVANYGSTAGFYQHFIHIPVTFQFGAVGFDMSFEHFVNDALMAIFFMTVAIEIKHEMLHGHLSSFKQASFPFFGAIGGMLVPALIYYALNYSHPQLAEGWAVPMATDIAFALGVLSLLGNKVPSAVKVFLLALAVIDDLGAIVVIAIFYTSDLNIPWLISGIVALSLMIVFNRANLRSITPYFLVTIVVWYTFLKSGIHATIAGVLGGFIIPNRDINGRNLSSDLEHYFAPYVKWFIIPLFAFVNSGVVLNGLSDGLQENLPLILGIFLGLFIGKPVGIFLITYLASLFHLTEKPKSMSWATIFFVGIICGIGFTMSIFITNLSFPGETEIERLHTSIARLSILSTSALAAIIGLVLTNLSLSRNQPKAAKLVNNDDY